MAGIVFGTTLTREEPKQSRLRIAVFAAVAMFLKFRQTNGSRTGYNVGRSRGQFLR